MEQCIFMVGARASGKTTLGRLLAARLGYRFFDTDQYLLETLGVSVAEIVAQEGWEGFRSREAAALRAVAGPSTVVATGGGMVLLEANRGGRSRLKVEKPLIVYREPGVYTDEIYDIYGY